MHRAKISFITFALWGFSTTHEPVKQTRGMLWKSNAHLLNALLWKILLRDTQRPRFAVVKWDRDAVRFESLAPSR
jgi:hypothetical protein